MNKWNKNNIIFYLISKIVILIFYLKLFDIFLKDDFLSSINNKSTCETHSNIMGLKDLSYINIYSILKLRIKWNIILIMNGYSMLTKELESRYNVIWNKKMMKIYVLIQYFHRF
jgi:hypothetical protein